MNLFTRIFRRSSSHPEESEEADDHSASRDYVGCIAKTISPLRATGYALLNGERLEVISANGFLPVGTFVRITGKRMGLWLVEKVEPHHGFSPPTSDAA